MQNPPGPQGKADLQQGQLQGQQKGQQHGQVQQQAPGQQQGLQQGQQQGQQNNPFATSASVKEILKDKKKIRFVAESAFKQVDKDDSGFLERPELEEVMNNVAQDLNVDPPTPDEVDEVLEELDVNGDGKLSIDEFQVLIEQVLEMMAKVE